MLVSRELGLGFKCNSPCSETLHRVASQSPHTRGGVTISSQGRRWSRVSTLAGRWDHGGMGGL